MCKTRFDSLGMILNGFKKNHFSKNVNGTRDPPPLHGKCRFKFPFWLLEPFPYHYSMIIHYTQLWILSRLHSYIPASAFIIFILFIAQWNGDLNLWSQHYHCLLLLFLITITVISCSGAARGFDQCPSWVSIQKASFDPIRSFTLSN